MKPTQEEIVTKYINLVYYFARRWVNNKADIDDVVQETYLKAFKHYDSFVFTSENQLKSWLLTICRNMVISSSRGKITTIQHKAEEQIEDKENNIEQWMEEEIKKDDLQKLDKQFGKLKDEEKDILRLRFYEELSFLEISEVLKIPEAAAKMRCYRALQKLREKFI